MKISKALRLQPSRTRENKSNHLETKTFYFLTQLLKTLTSSRTSPVSDFKSSVRTSAIKLENLQYNLSHCESAEFFSRQIYFYDKKIQWIFL